MAGVVGVECRQYARLTRPTTGRGSNSATDAPCWTKYPATDMAVVGQRLVVVDAAQGCVLESLDLRHARLQVAFHLYECEMEATQLYGEGPAPGPGRRRVFRVYLRPGPSIKPFAACMQRLATIVPNPTPLGDEREGVSSVQAGTGSPHPGDLAREQAPLGTTPSVQAHLQDLVMSAHDALALERRVADLLPLVLLDDAFAEFVLALAPHLPPPPPQQPAKQ